MNHRESTSLTSQHIGIGITTKDRWDCLFLTLSRIEELGMAVFETIVIDDGSLTPVSPKMMERFPWVHFLRSESSLGLISQRNRLASLLSCTYILGLDDDSFPLSGDIFEAMEWMQNHPEVVALAFRVQFQDSSETASAPSQVPFSVRDFIGCANMIHRSLFVKIGGYEERLSFFNEEAEFCLRAIQSGYEIHAYPAVVIQHNASPIGRNFARRARTFIRNEMLLALWYFPLSESLLRSLRILPAILLKNPEWRNYPFHLALGYFEAPFRYLTWSKPRKRFTASEYQDWKALPSSS